MVELLLNVTMDYKASKTMETTGIGRKGTVTEITWPFDASVFEKLRFWPSTQHHLAGVFKFLHPGDRFQKAPFSVTENAVLVWTVGQTGGKKMHFQAYICNNSLHASHSCKDTSVCYKKTLQS